MKITLTRNDETVIYVHYEHNGDWTSEFARNFAFLQISDAIQRDRNANGKDLCPCETCKWHEREVSEGDKPVTE